MPKISSKEIQWVLNKALPTITFSTSSISLDANNLTKTVTVTRTDTGEITASSNNTSVATVSVNDNVLTITGVANGSTTITVNVEATDNYKSSSSNLNVSVALSMALADCSPSDIKSIVDSGTASTMWSVGDTTATITMNGTVSDGLTLSNYQCKAILIGLDHNKAKETGGKSSAHFILGKDTSNKEIAFCDWAGAGAEAWGTKSSGTWFNHSNANSNSGGWKNSNLRANILPKFKSALPSAWQNILGTVTKYSDNTGGGSNTASYVTTTSDQLFLLAEWEVFGTKTYANSAEQNNQQQYTYFANGNSKVRYDHRSTSSPVVWWLRSVYTAHASYFVSVYTDGSVNNRYTTRYTCGVVPGFAIVKS